MRLFMTTDAVGGVWTYAVDLAAALGQRGIRVTLAALGPSPTDAQRAEASAAGAALLDTGLPLDWTAEDPNAVARAGEALAALAARHAADVVQLNSPALGCRARFAAPVVAVAHSCVATWWSAVKAGPLPADLAWRAAQTRDGLFRAAATVAPTAAFAAALQRAYALATPPIAVRNGRAAAPCPPRDLPPFAFTAGRLWDEGKGARTLDRAAAGLPWPLRAAGPTTGPNGAVVALDHAHRLGSLDAAEVRHWLAARPVFVSAARYEPFGLAALEAAQAGCALVLSDIPTFRELWDGVATFVAAEDDAGFAAAMAALLRNPAAREAAGARAAAHAARYAVGACADAMSALYAPLVAAGQRAAA